MSRVHPLAGFQTSDCAWRRQALCTPCGLEPFAAVSPLPQEQSYSQVMSAVPTTDNLDSNLLCSVVEHVFMPPKLPQVGADDETERKPNVALCNNLLEAAQDFLQIIPSTESPLWMRMIKMMELVRRAAEAPLTEDGLQRALSDMVLGGMYRYLALCPDFDSTFLRQTYFACISGHKTLLSSSAGLPPPTVFSSKCSKSCQ